MADIRLDFGVDKGVSKINIEKDLTDIVNQLPTFGIKVGVNAESLQEFKAQLESTKEQINGLKDFQLNLGGANVAIQTAGELDATIKDILTQLKSLNTIPIGFADEVISFSTAFSNIYTDIDSIKMSLRSLSSAIKGVGTGDIISISTLLDNIENAILTIDDTIKDMGRIKLDSSIKSQFEGLVNSITLIENSLQSVRTFTLPQGLTNNINDILVQLRSVNQAITDIWSSFAEFGTLDSAGQQMISLTEQFIKLNNGIHSVTDAISGLKANLVAAFSDGNQGLVNFDIELNRIRDTIKNNKTEVYTGTSWFGYDEAKRLEVMNADLGTLTEQLSQISKILMQISTLVDTISKKEFSITNTFTGNLENFKDKAQETRLYRDRLLELYKVVRDYNSEAERMASTRYVNGEVNRLFQQIPGTGISNVFEMLNQLEELGVSERSIYSMSNMKSIEAKMGRLNELKSIYETLFQEVQKYQQAESKSALAKTGFEIKMPDMSGFQKANEALDKYLNKITEIKTAAADAAMQQVSSKQTAERLETAKQIAAIVEQSLAAPQQQLSGLQTKITETFDLSKITPNTEKITQTLSGVKQQLTEIQAQIRSTFDLSTIPFDTTKITSGVAGIKNQLSEIQVQVNGIFDPSKMIFDPKSIEQIAAATKNAFDLSGANLDSSKFTRFTAEITQQLTRIQNQLRTTFNTANLVIDTAKVDDFLRHVSGELVRIQNQLRETFNGARLVVDTAKVGDFTTEVKRQIAEVKAEIATIFDLSGVTFDYTQFDAFTGRIKSGFDEIRTSVKSSLDGIKAYINEVTGAYANLLVQIDKAANNPVVQKVAATIPVGGAGQTTQQAVAVHELAQAHTELAQAEAASTAATKANNFESEKQAMSWRAKETLAQSLFSTQRELDELLKKNSRDQSAEYARLKDTLNILSEAASKVRENTNNVEHVFKDVFGKTADYLTRVKTEMLSFKAQMQELGTGGHVTESQFYGAISSMRSIQELYPDKAGLRVYDEIIYKLKQFERAEAGVRDGIISIDHALNYAGLEGKNVIQDVLGLIQNFNAQISDDAVIGKLHSQITALTGALKTAKESGKEGVVDSSQFNIVESHLERMKAGLYAIEHEGKTSKEAFGEFETTASRALERAKIAVSDLKTLINESPKAEKIIDATELQKSIATLQGLKNKAEENKNSILQTRAEYIDLDNQLRLANNALGLVKHNSLTAEEALKEYHTNGAKYMKDLDRIVSAYNIALKETESQTIRTNNAAKAQVQSVKEFEQFYSLLASMKKIEALYPDQKGLAVYDKIIAKLSDFRRADELIINDGKSMSNALSEVGYTGTKVFTDINKLITEFNARIAGETSIVELRKQIESISGAIKTANGSGKSGIADSEQLKNVNAVMELFKKALDEVETKEKSVNQAFLDLNTTTKQAFDGAKIAVSDLKTLLNETANPEKLIDATGLEKSIIVMQGLKTQALKLPESIKTQEYLDLTNQLNLARYALEALKQDELSADEALRKYHSDGVEYMSDMTNAVNAFNIVLRDVSYETTKANIATKEQAQAAKEIEQFYGAMASMKTIETMYPSQKGVAVYDNIIAKLKEFRRAEELVATGEKSIKEALSEIGYTGTTVFSEINGLVKEFNAQMVGEASAEKLHSQITSLTGAIASAQKAQDGGKKGITDSAQFKQVQVTLDEFRKALNDIEGKGKTSSEAFSKFGMTVNEAFEKAKISMSDLKTLINETEKAAREKAAPAIKEINATQLAGSIAKMRDVLNSIDSKKLYTTRNTQEYAELIKQITNARQAFALLKTDEMTAEEALSGFYQNGAQYMEQYKNAVSAFNVILKDAQGDKIISDNAAKVQAQAMKETADAEAKAAKEARDLKDAYQQVYDKILQMQSVLGTARGHNEGLVDTQAYKTVEGYLARFQNLADVATGPARVFTNIFDIFKASGPDFENSMRAAKLAMTQLRIEMGETEKEATETEPKITSLAKAYDMLARGNKLLNKNPEHKGTAGYTEIANNIAELQRLVDLVDKGVMTVGGTYRKDFANLDEVFKSTNIDGEKLFETLRVGISRFNNELAQTEKSMSLDQAYKKLESMQNLLSNKKGKTLVGTDEYNAVQNSIAQMDKAIKIAEGDQISLNQAFEQMNTISSKALADMDLAMEKFKVLRSGTSVTDIDKVMRETQAAQNLLNGNQSMTNDLTYQKLKSNIDLMSEAISKARANGRTLDVELKEMGYDGQKVFQDIKLGVLDFQAAMRDAGVSGTTTEVKLERAMNSLKKLQADADKYQGRSFNLNGSPAVIEQTEQYTKLQAQIQTVAKALDLMRNSGLGADEALVQLRTTGTELFGDIELNSVRMKGAIDQVTRAYKEATSGAKANNQEEKNRQNLIAKAYSLMSKSQKITTNWTMAATGKSASSYRDIQGYANALGNLISQFKAGSISSADFSRQIATIDAGLKQDITTIQAAGENAASLSLRLNNIAQRFGAWFGATRIIMRVITSLKQMISTSIELDDAFTQLQIVTKDTDATYERFGSTVARIAKETAVSMKDITDAATTFARLGYNLDEAAKLAEYTAKLQNVGDIETQEAQDAITSILKAYDEVDADHIEEVMNKLITTGKYNCPTVW